MAINLDIAQEFSSYPSGITYRDGVYNAELFRKNILLPKYMEAKDGNAKLHIHLDGVKSFSASFLSEAFGGLIEKEALNKDDLLSRIHIEARNPINKRYVYAIYRYISEI